MPPTVHGLHHITCIAGDPQLNVDFYAGLLGMRLVKRSVNQDVPDTYHLFYADGAGTPGTDLTFFPWPAMERSRRGIGLAVEVALAVPAASLGYWGDRLRAAGVDVGEAGGGPGGSTGVAMGVATVDGTGGDGARSDGLATRFGETVLPFRDPDGLHLALVATDDERPFVPWDGSAVPTAHQIRGLHAVRLWERDMGPTVAALTTLLGLAPAGVEDSWHRYAAGSGGSGTYVDVRELPEERRGTWGTGGVHHVAWRVDDVAEGTALRRIVEDAGLRPSPVIDRFWFESIYFKEPGGTLFELATEGPGFGRDEDMAHLGEQLILPPWLEVHRGAIEAALPALVLPEGSTT